MRGMFFLDADRGIGFDTRSYGMIQERKDIGLPEPQTYTVEVPGRDGVLNLSKALNGRISYRNRELVFRYLISGSRDEIDACIHDLSMLQGQHVYIFDNEGDIWYYDAYITIEITREPAYAIAVITADAQPYQYRFINTVEEFMIVQNTIEPYDIYNPGVPVVPWITNDKPVKITVGDYSITVGKRTKRWSDPRIILENGYTEFEIEGTDTVAGTGTLTMTFTEARI